MHSINVITIVSFTGYCGILIALTRQLVVELSPLLSTARHPLSRHPVVPPFSPFSAVWLLHHLISHIAPLSLWLRLIDGLPLMLCRRAPPLSCSTRSLSLRHHLFCASWLLNNCNLSCRTTTRHLSHVVPTFSPRAVPL